MLRSDWLKGVDYSIIHPVVRLNPDNESAKKAKLSMFSLWEGLYNLFPVNHSNTSESWASLSSCVWKRVDSAVLRMCYAAL